MSNCTKRMKIINDYDVEDGRRIDLLGLSNHDNEKVEICSVESKKANASTQLHKYQQSKNVRINACILNNIHLLLHDTDTSFAYLDFAGREAYILQLYQFHGTYISQKVDSVYIPKLLPEAELFRQLLFNLYRWKSHLITVSNQVSVAHINEERRYSLIDVGEELLISSPAR